MTSRLSKINETFRRLKGFCSSQKPFIAWGREGFGKRGIVKGEKTRGGRGRGGGPAAPPVVLEFHERIFHFPRKNFKKSCWKTLIFEKNGKVDFTKKALKNAFFKKKLSIDFRSYKEFSFRGNGENCEKKSLKHKYVIKSRPK